MAADPLLRDIIELVIRDEARHVAFGVAYMEQFVKSLPPDEIEERAQFAFEACRVMRERIVPTDVFEHYGFDVEEGRRRFLAAGQMDMFRNLLFTRIMPNLNKVGLLTESVQRAVRRARADAVRRAAQRRRHRLGGARSTVAFASRQCSAT